MGSDEDGFVPVFEPPVLPPLLPVEVTATVRVCEAIAPWLPVTVRVTV